MSKSTHTGGGIRNPLTETLAFHTAPVVVFGVASVICLPDRGLRRLTVSVGGCLLGISNIHSNIE